MSDNPPDHTMLLKQQKQMLDELAYFREQLVELIESSKRVETAVTALIIEVCAMKAQEP